MQATFQYLMDRELKWDPRGRHSFFQRRFDLASNLYSKDLRAHYSCVNAVEFGNSSELMASGKQKEQEIDLAGTNLAGSRVRFDCVVQLIKLATTSACSFGAPAATC